MVLNLVKEKKKHIGVFILLVCVFLIVSFSVVFFSPKEIVDFLGVTNSYFALFGIALLGGASFLTSSSYFASIILLSGAGLSKVLVALVAGVALTLGDMFIYSVGKVGKRHIPKKVGDFFDRVSLRINKYPKWLLPVFIFVYTGVTPLPADLLMLFLSFTGVSLKRVFLPMLLGNILLAGLVSHIFG